ncbi:hypothetical protein J2Z42_000279 [Clostridium algifaecis]|uniref:Uncharacterized protein n=1 Tax=Clostridium algifaecis TaxID=1472040 RepID=A0ABS4KRW2_9CLOT|nr:hypothetical protein [Clostridium algifaecis]MBP2031614.1 hypothetical protein [Clostridium algifaecis]
MGKKCLKRRTKRKIGIIVVSVGVGLMLTIIIPIWGWIIAGGTVLIYFGWCLIENHR